MKKIRLLFIAEELEINGAAVSLIALLNALPAERYDISLFLFNPVGEMIKDIPGHVNILPVSLPYAAHRIPLKSAVKKMFQKGRLDLVIYRLLVSIQRYFNLKYILWFFLPKIPGNYDVACCYNDGFVAPTMVRKVNASKKVAWIHFTYSDWPQKSYIYDALKKCDICVPVSIATGNDLDRVIGKKLRKQVIHNIIDSSRCWMLASEECEIPRKDGVFRIVTIGRITDQKNVRLILPTAQILRDANLIFEWYVIGNGDLYDELHSLSAKMNPYLNVHFIGSRYNVMPWVKSADVIVNPSKFEAWGMTVSEALCLGKAVITSDIPVFAEQITNGINGLMCKASPDILSKAILQLYSDKELKKRLELNAIKYKFTKEYVLAEFNHMIASLMKRS